MCTLILNLPKQALIEITRWLLNLKKWLIYFVECLFLCRLFGLKDIIIPGNCSSPYDLNLNANHDWPVYVNPGILLLLYITIATVLKTGCHGTPNQVSSTLLVLTDTVCLHSVENVQIEVVIEYLVRVTITWKTGWKTFSNFSL